MKTSNIIIAILIVAIIGGFLFLYLKRKKTSTTGQPDQPEQKTKVPAQGTEYVRKFQNQINMLLPENYTKLIEDGIWGPKTQAAYEKVKNLKAIGVIPTTKAIEAGGSTVNINTDDIFNNLVSLAGKGLNLALSTNPITAPTMIIGNILKR